MTDFFEGAGNGSEVDVGALLDSDAISGHLVGIITHGALLSLGRTSDGGALSVTVTLDGRWRREYFRHQEELATWLEQAFDAVASAPPASSGRGRGQRGTRAR